MGDAATLRQVRARPRSDKSLAGAAGLGSPGVLGASAYLGGNGVMDGAEWPLPLDWTHGRYGASDTGRATQAIDAPPVETMKYQLASSSSALGGRSKTCSIRSAITTRVDRSRAASMVSDRDMPECSGLGRLRW